MKILTAVFSAALLAVPGVALAQSSASQQSNMTGNQGYSQQQQYGQSSQNQGQQMLEGCITRRETDFYITPENGAPIRLQANNQNLSGVENHQARVYGQYENQQNGTTAMNSSQGQKSWGNNTSDARGQEANNYGQQSGMANSNSQYGSSAMSSGQNEGMESQPGQNSGMNSQYGAQANPQYGQTQNQPAQNSQYGQTQNQSAQNSEYGQNQSGQNQYGQSATSGQNGNWSSQNQGLASQQSNNSGMYGRNSANNNGQEFLVTRVQTVASSCPVNGGQGSANQQR